MPPLCFAYYCSGHGYGHATRVSAFACHLLNLPLADRPTVYITSSAPKHVFSDSIALGALYRYAEIDPVIVQPLAYRVDRQKSVEVLKLFFSRKQAILDAELKWLGDIKADTVLSDAAFLGCLAAKAAGIPSILITNFTFDSVYSYLSTTLQQDLECSVRPNHLSPDTSLDDFSRLVPDIPVISEELDPLVAQIYDGYRCADLLFLLPGHIPIPSFSLYPCLPSPDWVDTLSNRFHPIITDLLLQAPSSFVVPPSVAFPGRSKPSRSIISAPLLVRPPTSTPGGRSQLLDSIGIPSHLYDSARTKILIVSFGGQVFRAPSRSTSRNISRSTTPTIPSLGANRSNGISVNNVPEINLPPLVQSRDGSDIHCPIVKRPGTTLEQGAPRRLATQSHIWIPGAPPASKPPASAVRDSAIDIPELPTALPTPYEDNVASHHSTSPEVEQLENESDLSEPRLLPDESWIAIVCGTSKDQWIEGDANSSGLPEGFFVAPKDVYMPDLTAAGDVLLGKLGYGTVSECVDSCTPFVYVSRPLFIEEHGLRLLLDRDGVGVELSRQSYEAGDWAIAVEEAWARGKEAKARKREAVLMGKGIGDRKKEGLDMARKLVSWTHDWRGSNAWRVRHE